MLGDMKPPGPGSDRKSTRLNSSHMSISYAFFCLKKNRRPPRARRRRVGPHSSGTVGREAAVRHGVTNGQRMLNPLFGRSAPAHARSLVLGRPYFHHPDILWRRRLARARPVRPPPAGYVDGARWTATFESVPLPLGLPQLRLTEFVAP